MPEYQTQCDDTDKAGTHDTVGKGSLPSVTLNVVFHITGTAKEAGKDDPGGDHPFFRAVVFHSPKGENDQNSSQRNSCQDLNHADKTVAAQIQRIVACAVKNYRAAL